MMDSIDNVKHFWSLEDRQLKGTLIALNGLNFLAFTCLQ